LFIHFVSVCFTANNLIKVNKLNGTIVCTSRTNLQNIFFFSFILFHVLQKFRPGTNQTHFPQENLSQLRTLIQLCFSEKISDSCYATIMQGGCPTPYLICVFYHASKFTSFKRTIFISSTRSTVKNW